MKRLLIVSVLGVVAFATASRGVDSDRVSAAPEAAPEAAPKAGPDVFWHTDLAAANAEAVESGKPLLIVFR